MSTVPGLTIDSNLQLRVQVALVQWTENCSEITGDRIRVLANRRGEVTLRGRVEDRELSEAASQVAQAVPGVRLVFNQITITHDSRPAVTA